MRVKCDSALVKFSRVLSRVGSSLFGVKVGAKFRELRIIVPCIASNFFMYGIGAQILLLIDWVDIDSEKTVAVGGWNDWRDIGAVPFFWGNVIIFQSFDLSVVRKVGFYEKLVVLPKFEWPLTYLERGLVVYHSRFQTK